MYISRKSLFHLMAVAIYVYVFVCISLSVKKEHTFQLPESPKIPEDDTRECTKIEATKSFAKCTRS